VFSSRFSAAWEEFWKSIAWIDKVTDRPEKVKKLVGILVIVLGPLGFGLQFIPAAKEWSALASPFVPYLLVVAAIYVTFQVATAWEKVKGPIVWMGKIEFEKYFRFFEFSVENRGHGEVVARVYATKDLRDQDGDRIPQIDNQMELHWRGRYVGEDVKLAGSEIATAGILGLRLGDTPNTAHLVLLTPGKKNEYGMVSLVYTAPTPLNEQQRLYLTIRVAFFNEKGELVADKKKRLAIIPYAKSPSCYKVRPVRWLWE
jgi:hypothetical protein